MGCDIHSFAERKNAAGEWEQVGDMRPFDDRSYRVFGFLAGVRNYSGTDPISAPRGMPDDASAEVEKEYDDWGCDAHTPSWLSISELESFDYDATTEDRRVTRQLGPNYWDGGCTAEPGEGRKMTYREFLGDSFFSDIAMMKEAGVERVVFWFDS